MVIGDIIVCANLGDSRALLCRGKKALVLSKEHSVKDAQELRRMNEASHNCLEESDFIKISNLSRSFGRIVYKTGHS